ncbi:tRNA nucleotidyltransferase [Bacillus sp. JCM 19047]|nr:tRNA nucleotidyltransferase [Bacillus sp. JCM 19047]
MNKHVEQCLQTLHEKGYEAYLVGGAVRDYLLGLEPKDFDITTSASPEQIEACFHKTIRINERFQTVLVYQSNVQIEVSTFKGRTFVDDIQARDFTINSLAYSLKDGVLDLVNGTSDLTNKCIRSYRPEEILQSDPLRILRAARFVSTLGFHVEKETLQACQKYANGLTAVARERMAVEWVGLLKGGYKHKAFSFLETIRLEEVLPFLTLHPFVYNVLKSNESVSWDSDVRALVEYCLIAGTTDMLAALPFSNQVKKQVKQRYHMYHYRLNQQWSDWELYQAGLSMAIEVEKIRQGRGMDFEALEKMKNRYQELPIQSKSDLDLTGRDLIEELNKKPGPWVKAALEQLQKAVVERVVPNERDALIHYYMRESE